MRQKGSTWNRETVQLHTCTCTTKTRSRYCSKHFLVLFLVSPSSSLTPVPPGEVSFRNTTREWNTASLKLALYTILMQIFHRVEPFLRKTAVFADSDVTTVQPYKGELRVFIMR